MAKWSEVYGGKYLNAENFSSEPVEYIIEGVDIDSVKSDDSGERERVLLHLEGEEKAVIVNATNAENLREAFGDSPESCIGQKVKISTHKVRFRGKYVDGVNIVPA